MTYRVEKALQPGYFDVVDTTNGMVVATRTTKEGAERIKQSLESGIHPGLIMRFY